MDNTSILKLIKLENLLTSELKKRKLNLFNLQLVGTTINLWVYSSSLFEINFNKKIINFYKKKRNIRRLNKKYGLSNYEGLLLLKKNEIRNLVIQKLDNLANVYFFITKIFLLKSKLLKLLVLAKFLKINQLCCAVVTSSMIKYILFINVNFFCVNTKKKKRKHFFKLRKFMQDIIKYKLASIQLENILYKILHKTYVVNLQNILLETKNFLTMTKMLHYKKEKIQMMYVIVLASMFSKSQLIADFLSIKLRLGINHRSILYKFTEVLEQLFYSNVLNLLGIQIRVSGKLGGKMRKSKYHYKLGKVQLQTLRQPVSYSYMASYTKFGVLSIKV